MNKKKTLIIAVIILFFSAVVVLSFFNTTKVQKGYVYYSVAGNYYKYNLLTKCKQEITIDGYDSVNELYPTDDGYYAQVSKYKPTGVEEYPDYYFLHNGEVLFTSAELKSNRFHKFYLHGDTFFFLVSEDNEPGETLAAYNLTTKQYIKISDNVNYGYSVVGDYIYYSDENFETPEVEKSIYIVNINSQPYKPTLVDKGLICKNTRQELIYTKSGEYYKYDFDAKKTIKVTTDSLKQDELKNQYLCSVKVENYDFDIHLKTQILYDKDRYKTDEEYYKFLKNGGVGIDFVFLRHFSIDSVDGRIIIPILKRNCEAEFIAFEHNGIIYYPDYPCVLE